MGTEQTQEPTDRAWERQDGESDRAWTAFCSYRDLPAQDRSISNASQALAARGSRLNANTAKKLAQRFAWRARVMAYDTWRDRQRTRAELEEVKEMRRRHIQMAMSLQGAAALALNKIIEAERTGKTLTLKPTEVRDLADLGMRVERLSRGEPTAIDESRDVPDSVPSGPVAQQSYSKLSRDELLNLRALLDKARSEGA